MSGASRPSWWPGFDADAIRRPTSGIVSDKPACYLCGRPVGKNPATVHLLTTGCLAPVDADVAPRDDQGWFEIGASCKRLVPRSYRIG